MHLSRMRIAMHLDRSKVVLGIEYSIRLRRASNSSKSVMWLLETDAVPCTKIHYKACTWLREFSSSSHLTALPSLALPWSCLAQHASLFVHLCFVFGTNFSSFASIELRNRKESRAMCGFRLLCGPVYGFSSKASLLRVVYSHVQEA